MRNSFLAIVAVILAAAIGLSAASAAETASAAKESWNYQEVCIEQAENSWRCDFWRAMYERAGIKPS